MKTVPLYRPNRIQTGHAHDEIAHPPANALAARKQPAGKKQPVKKEASIGLSEEEKRSCHRTPGFAVASTGPPPSSTQRAAAVALLAALEPGPDLEPRRLHS